MLPGMAVFISVTTSAFSLDARRQPYTGVRRPMRGLQIKEDTYAIIRVLTATGEELTLLDGGADSTESEDGIGRSSRYSNFLIQALQDQRAEKRQIIETFGEDYVFFFGETPRFLNVSGVLLNTADFNWRNEWWENYERHLRGTRLVEQNARLYLYFDDVVVEGYIVSSSTDNQATSKELVPFTFQLFVTNYACIGAVGSIRFQSEEQAVGVPPVGNSAQTQDSVSRAGGLAGVLAQAARFQNDASFSVQNTLENIKAQFIGQSGALSIRPPEPQQARIPPAPTGRPIWENRDEYIVTGEAPSPPYDKAALTDAKRKQEMQRGIDIATAARIQLLLRGIDPTGRESEFLLLGRNSFGEGKYGSFGLRRASGEILDAPLKNLPEEFRGIGLP